MNSHGHTLAIALTAALLAGAGVSIGRPFGSFATPVRAATPTAQAAPVPASDVASDVEALTRRVSWDKMDIDTAVEGF